MEGPTFRKSYTNKSQYIYDDAVTSDYFDLASYNAAKNDENTEVADLYAAFATTAKNKQSPTFNMDDYELLSGDYNTQMLYLENELLTDRNEMSADNTYNIYDKNKEYLDSIIDQKRREKWYNELNDWDKFWTNVGNVAGDALNAVYGIVDKVSDALVLLYGASADMLTAGQFHQQISEGTKHAIDLDWTGTEKIASELDKLRSVTAVGKDGFLKAVDEVVTGIANMAPILIPGLGQLGQLAYGASMLGGAASEAINKNPDIDLFDLSLYSAAVAGVEYGTEFISGKIFGGADLIGSKMMGTPVRQSKGWLSRIGMDFVSEAFEEGVSEIVDSLLDVALVRGVDSKIASMQDILHAALIGGVTGAIITGAGIAFTSNDAINTKTNEIVNYSKAIAEGVNPDVLKKLSKIDTINMREALSQATQAMRVNHVDEFYVNKNRNEGLSEEQARQKYSKEYEKAVKLDEENAKQIADAATILTKVMEWAGAKGFVKAADILDFAKEEQARLIRNFTEKQPTDNLKYKLLEKTINDKFPNTSFSVNEELTAAQLNLQDSMKKEYGIDVVYGKYGNPDGISKNTSFALNENTIVLDSELYKSTSTRELAEKYAKQSLVQAFQLKSGVLSPDNIKIINDVLNSTKFTNYNASIIENIKELQSKDVNKLSNAELQKYAKLQQETMAQLLLFDDTTIGKVFMGSPKTFKQTWKWLTQQGNFFKNLIKTPTNKLQFNYVMKSLRRYENAVVNNSPNLQYMKDAAKDLGADEETVVRMERQYNPNNKPKNFEHWAYMPITKNTNYEDYMHVSYVMSDLTNNNFTFENAFNPEIYQDETLRSLWLADNTHGKTFKYNLQNYLINNHGFVIDDVHKQFVRVTEFAQHTALNWTTDLMGLEDGATTLTDLQYDYRTVGDVFSEEFNDNVYNKESGENLYDYRLKFIRVDRNKYKNTWGVTDFTNKTIEIYVDPNAKKLDVELAQIEHTIYHETQHIIANWTNMYQGGDVTTITKAMMLEPKQEKIKTLYETLNDDTFNGEESQYTELAVQIYALLGGEWLAESERLKFNPVNVKRVYDKSTVFGQTDYLDVSYTPQGNGLKMTIKGYGFYKNIKLDLFITEQNSLTVERNYTNDISDIKGNLTEEFKELQNKRSWKDEAKRLIDNNAIGDETATNEVISKLYPNNKHATTIEYVDQVMNDIPYLLWYKKRNSNIDKNKVLDMNEVRQFVESDLDTQEKLKQYEEKQNQAGDYVKRRYILSTDFNYTLNDVAKVEANTNLTEGHRGQRAMEQQTTVDERSESYEEAQEAISNESEAVTESAEAKYEMLDTAVEQIKNNIEKTPEKGFEFINNLLNYAKNNLDKSQQKYLEKQLIKENILPKKQYEKLINKYKTELSSKTLNAEETELFNKNISEFTDINQYRDYVDDLKEIARRHENDIQEGEKADEYDFGTIQEESRREVADDGWGSKSKEIDENVRTRLSRVLGEKINSDRSSYGDNSRLLKLTGKENTFEVYENINPNTFRDCFEITRAYLPYGELVDLHDIEDSEKHGIGYNKCECYLSKDGLSGFAITPDGDLISVFNGNEKRGFLRAIAPIIREKVKTLDCFISYKQNLQDMYSKLFGFKTASVMDYNMEYDHDKIAETHNKPKVAFMVNTNADVQTKNFIETDYDGAKAYQMSFANEEQKTVKEKKPRKKKTVIETLETATQSEPSSLGEAIVALMESDEIKTKMSEVQNVGESNQELKSVSKDIWRNHADIFAGINDSNYETVRNTIEKSGNRTALIEFDYYCREFKGRFNKETTKLIDDNAQKVLHESGQVLATQSHTLYNSKPINDIVNSLGEDGYTVDVDDSVIAEYDERLANKDKHISDLEQQIKDLEQQLQNKDLNALEKADISDELQKVAEEKYVFENGSNIDLMDWLLNNVDAPTIAEVFAKQTEIQKSFLDKLIFFAERAQIEGKDIGFYLKSKETGDIKAFPKTREFLAKWLKKIRNYRMWAMLSSPTTWVRNWVGNTGMKSLDTVTNAFERMLSRKVFSDIDYTKAMNTIQFNNNKISQMFEKLSTLKEGSTAYNNLDNQIKKLQKETHKLEFDIGQLKYQETRAGKEVYKHISEQYGDYILNHLIRKSDSKYDETGGKGGALKQIERDIAYQSANTLQKLVIKAQDITQWGLSTGIFGDEPMVMNAIIKNFGNLVASNTDYLLAGIQIEYDALRRKTKPSETDKKRLAILKKALKTKDVNAICDAMNESETKRFFDSATHRAEEQYFKNGNWLSRTMSDLAKKSPIFGEIMSWVMPFPKVAANILTMAYKYSPAGFISTLVQWSKYKQKSSIDYKGQITGFEKADIIRSASQATTGTFMLIAGALMAALGVIDIDDDDYLGPALKVGNFMRISLSDLAPSMTTFSTAAALVYAWKNHKSGVEEALNNLYDNTLLGNVDNIFRYGGLTKFAENIPISLTGQYVPAVLKLINNTVFKTPQKDKSGNLLEKTWKTLAASIPGLSATVPNKINPYTGEPMYASGSENWFLNFLAKASPITVKYTYGKSALEQEAARLNTTTTGLSGTFTFNGKNVTVNNKEQLAKFRANYIESEFDKIQSDKSLVTVKDTKTGKMITTKYSKLTDTQKQNVLTSLFSKASNAAKVEYWTQSGNKYIATSTEEYQRLKKTVTTPSKIIFNKNWSKSKFVEA